MLMVDTIVKASSRHGLGLFMERPIKQGDVVWAYDSRFDRAFTNDEIKAFPDSVRKCIERYSMWDHASGLYVFCGDNARYTNHSNSPNLVSVGAFGIEYAARDIGIEEELTANYLEITDDPRQVGLRGHRTYQDCSDFLRSSDQTSEILPLNQLEDVR